jgi:hypothetical protein
MTDAAGAETALSGVALPAVQTRSRSPGVASDPERVPLFTLLH